MMWGPFNASPLSACFSRFHSPFMVRAVVQRGPRGHYPKVPRKRWSSRCAEPRATGWRSSRYRCADAKIAGIEAPRGWIPDPAVGARRNMDRADSPLPACRWAGMDGTRSGRSWRPTGWAGGAFPPRQGVQGRVPTAAGGGTRLISAQRSGGHGSGSRACRRRRLETPARILLARWFPTTRTPDPPSACTLRLPRS